MCWPMPASIAAGGARPRRAAGRVSRSSSLHRTPAPGPSRSAVRRRASFGRGERTGPGDAGPGDPSSSGRPPAPIRSVVANAGAPRHRRAPPTQRPPHPRHAAPAPDPRLGYPTGVDRSIRNVILGTFTLRFSSGLTGALLVFYLAELHTAHGGPEVDAFTLGVMGAVFYLAELVLSPFFGVFSDRFGHHRVMQLGPIFGAVAVIMTGLTTNLVLLGTTRWLEGASTAASIPSILGFLAVVDGQRRTAARPGLGALRGSDRRGTRRRHRRGGPDVPRLRCQRVLHQRRVLPRLAARSTATASRSPPTTRRVPASTRRACGATCSC